jgi:MFS transporter, CP family, cyanate transporter
VALAPRQARAGEHAANAPERRWWPNWRDPLVWRGGLLLGSVNTIYWSANTFLPDYLHALGRPELVGDTLSALNGGQLPGSLLMLAWGSQLVRRRATYLVTAGLIAAGLIGMVASQGTAIVWWAALVGGANAMALILMLALPALLGAAQDVHRISAAMFTISYPCAVVLPILGGFAWDVTGIAALAFAPAALGALAILALSPGLKLGRTAPKE